MANKEQGKNKDKDKKKKKKSSKKKKSKVKDTVAPKLGYIPYVLNKGRGEKVWWNASDNVGIASYSFKFNGRTITQKGSSFNIPVKTSPGMYFLTISAFDKAGNKTSKTSIIKVR